MQLSIIIVNYNVRHFLEQCLVSVIKAAEKISSEIFVVDNNSVDGSCLMVREKFPQVKLIENKENVGFSKANNQAIALSGGKYILLLNPDTVVEESSFESCVSFMDQHPECGGLGVKMIDGKGRFLPESKRGLPTPSTAFWKIFGFSSLFPHSRIFSKYHLGYLDKNSTHEVEILAGACMFLRKEALDKTGWLDEAFFMYGEDIDLSYRLLLAGYKNYYFPGTTIIHYKGESTKKGSLNYVFTFYQAMIIFAKKHFSARNAQLFSRVIHLAIYFRASLSVLKRMASRWINPALDALTIFGGFILIQPVWEKFHFGIEEYYPTEYLYFVVPSYILIWILSVYFNGGYEKPFRIIPLLRGIIAGSLVILVIYALLPVSLRFSRAMILLGSAWTLITLPLLRFLLHLTGLQDQKLDSKKRKRILIAGSLEETERVKQLLTQTHVRHEVIGMVSPSETGSPVFLGNMDQMQEIVRVHKIDEIIFCSRDIPARLIIQQMLSLSQQKLDYKIAPEESLSVIGSNSIHTAGELYVVDFNLLAKESSRRNKRMLDILLSLLVLFISPVLAFLCRNPFQLFKNILLVFSGYKTWVGYAKTPGINPKLPALPPGILNPTHGIEKSELRDEQLDQLNLLYARDYRFMNDLGIIFRSIRKLDQS